MVRNLSIVVALVAIFCLSAYGWPTTKPEKPVRYTIKVGDYYAVSFISTKEPTPRKGKVEYSDCYNIFVVFPNSLEGKHHVLQGASEESHRYLISINQDGLGELTPWLDLRSFLDVTGKEIGVGYKRDQVPCWCTEDEFNLHPLREDR